MTRSRDVADTQDNLGGAVAPFVGGKNRLINADFGVNQRNFTSSTTTLEYSYDRWQVQSTGITSGTAVYSAQSFTESTFSTFGYEAKNYIRLITTDLVGSAMQVRFNQRIEDIRTFAGQTVTASFWAKAGSGTPKIQVSYSQITGGGSPVAVETNGGSVTLSTTWKRYSTTITLPSISGVTVGTGNNQLLISLFASCGPDAPFGFGVGIQNNTFDIWGVQLEAGSVATPFTPAGGGFPGAELALCQRYYQRFGASGTTNCRLSPVGTATSTTTAQIIFYPYSQFRVKPTAVDYANVQLLDGPTSFALPTLTLAYGISASVVAVNASSTALTTYRPYFIADDGTGTGFFGISAEL